MKTIGVRDLKARLNQKLREVQDGETATASVLHDALGSVTTLSLHARVRACAAGLGFPVLP